MNARKKIKQAGIIFDLLEQRLCFSAAAALPTAAFAQRALTGFQIGAYQYATVSSVGNDILVTSLNASSTAYQVDVFDLQGNHLSSQNIGFANEVNLGDKAIFIPHNSYGGLVPMFDADTGQWTSLASPVLDNPFPAFTTKTQAFFVGSPNSDHSYPIDIFDSVTETWSEAGLPFDTPGSDVEYPNGAGVASSALFVTDQVISSNETYVEKYVEILDQNSNTWHATQLPIPLGSLQTVVAGQYAFFAGDIWLQRHRQGIG